MARLTQAGQEVQRKCRQVGTGTIAAASFAAVMCLRIIIRRGGRTHGSSDGGRVDGLMGR